MESGALVIDTRETYGFGGAHLTGAYSIWLEGLPIFAGWVLPYDKPLLLVVEDNLHVEQAVQYLVRAGYERIKGYLKGGMHNWYTAGLYVDNLALLSVHQLEKCLDKKEDLTVLDVRGRDEWIAGHIENANHIYVGYLDQRLDEVPKEQPVAVICKSGHRSSMAASILLRSKYRNVSNALGGMLAWEAAGFSIVKY